MKPIAFNAKRLSLPPEATAERLHRMIENELTEKQRRAVYDYYFQGKSIPQLAQAYGVNKSAVCRLLQRALARMARILNYL